MKFSPGALFAGAVLALAVLWPFWHLHMRAGLPAASPEPLPGPEAAPAVRAAPAESDTAPRCPGCEDLRRLANRLRAREEGAARRLDAASARLSASPAGGRGRTQLESALRRARDDKRGAAAFRTAVVEALRLCASGSGCGETPLANYWAEGCPPEHPDLGREARALARLAHVLAQKAGACALASCPDAACGHLAHSSAQLAAAEHVLRRLIDPPDAEEKAASAAPDATRAAALLEETEDWRGRIPGLFNGGSDPSVQLAAASETAASLAAKFAAAREPGGAAPDPLWRLNVLSVRLEAMARALESLAAALRADDRGRDALLLAARRQAADAFRELLVAQLRLGAAREQLLSGADAARRCDARRRAQIARGLGRIRALRAALARCARRAACPAQTAAAPAPKVLPGLDPVSAWRRALDGTLIELSRAAHDLSVTAQAPVTVATGRAQYESGEAVAVRLDSRATACMSAPGSWAGLFAGGAPRLRGAEAAAFALRRLSLRGRPWEEVHFEAPRPGAYEVRTYVSERRGGGMTGRARFAVVPRPEGCSGFSGVWKTGFGRLQITVRGEEASGTYRRGGAWRPGFLTGRVQGRVLTGEWWSELGGGGTRLTLGEDGKTFSGTWSQFRDALAGAGVWKGTCEGPVRPPPPKGSGVN